MTSLRRAWRRLVRREPSEEVREARRNRARLEQLVSDARAESDAIMELVGQPAGERK